MAVIVRNLSKTFGSLKALDDISFSFARGQIHGFIGPNGAGKTTTMRIMVTLEDPTSGDIEICGLSILEKPQAVRSRISFVPDWFHGHRDMTVREYLDVFARMYGLRGKSRLKVLDEIEDFTRLAPLRDKLIHELSRGMQQRVCLGRALIHDPEILIMDEPAANLDPRARIEFRDLVRALAKRNKGILISSHILTELSEICDAVTIIDKGKILKSGDLAEYNGQTTSGLRPILIRLLGAQKPAEQILLEQPGVEKIEVNGSSVKVFFQGDDNQICDLLKNLAGRLNVLEFRPLDRGLEDIFMEITAEKEEG